jgi:hypothetical protein
MMLVAWYQRCEQTTKNPHRGGFDGFAWISLIQRTGARACIE